MAKKLRFGENNHSHYELVDIAYKWLLKSKGCSFAFKELSSSRVVEIPDCIGFRDGYSILVECKTTRADFLADKNKPFRKRPQDGIGAYRFYLSPEGVVVPGDLPDKWGLVWVSPVGRVRQIVGPAGNAWSTNGKGFVFGNRNTQGEFFLMSSALRRLHLRGFLDSIYEPL